MEKMVNMAAEAYISVMGREKWESLTDKQKHDAVMIIWKDFEKLYNAKQANA